LSRRDLIRRGAVVGTLVWVAPVISSINQPAFAASGGPGAHQATGDVDYNVPSADPGLSRHVKFSFDDTPSGTLHYSDTNGAAYDVTFSSTFFSGTTAYACGVISNSGGLGLNGQNLLIKVSTAPTLSGDVFGVCPALPSNPVTTAANIVGSITVT
jgi:hypothetical protein